MFDWPAYWRMSLPTSVEPVKVTLRRPCAAPAPCPPLRRDPFTTLNTPGGPPASTKSSASRRRLTAPARRASARPCCRPQRGRDLPGRHEQRVVPRRDRTDDTERLAQHQCMTPPVLVPHPRPCRCIRPSNGSCRSPREVAFDDVSDGLAHVERLEHGQLSACWSISPRSGTAPPSAARGASRDHAPA